MISSLTYLAQETTNLVTTWPLSHLNDDTLCPENTPRRFNQNTAAGVEETSPAV